MPLGTTEAAKLVGRSKQGIIKAIKTGKLSATKNLNGEWEIEPVELYRVYQPKTTGTPSPSVDEGVLVPDDALRRENELLRERISKQDDIISQLLDRLKTQHMLEDKQRLPWWQRLFR